MGFVMNHHQLELAATAFTFAGSALLAWKELFPVTMAYFERGAEKRKALKTGSTVKIENQQDTSFKEAKRSQWLSRPGFLLMMLGFLLDFFAKW